MRNYFAVGLGAIVGASLRYVLSEWLNPTWGSTFPWPTLLINVSGSLALGCLLSLLTERLVENPLYRLLLGTGLLGGYTTFSTFSYEAVELLERGAYLAAVAYVTASFGLSIAAAFVGIRLGVVHWRTAGADGSPARG